MLIAQITKSTKFRVQPGRQQGRPVAVKMLPHGVPAIALTYAPLSAIAMSNDPPGWTMESAPAPHVRINGREFLYFAGTGYLGLQSHPEVIAAAQAGAEQWGVHSATTRAGFGSSPPVLEVERRAAAFLGQAAACYLVTGYAVNFALAAAVSSQANIVLIDESAHDCLREALRWLDALHRPPLRFRHCDAGHLRELLKSELRPGDRPLVLTDGIFAASGRLAPLADYLSELDQYPGAMLLVDDAHGTGVVGPLGRGSLELAGISPERINRPEEATTGVGILHGTTLSKALGGHGGAIAGSRAFLDLVRQTSGWFRGASAPAAPVAAATAKALQLVAQHPELRAQLADNIARMREGLRRLGLHVDDSPAAIVSFELASAAEMQRVHASLLERGIAIAYTRDYAGAGPDGMLRVAVFATHTPDMIDRLVEVLGQLL
jgi:8-amino-7-oxononanoate synthase